MPKLRGTSKVEHDQLSHVNLPINRMKNMSTPHARLSARLLTPIILLGVLILLFWRGFCPGFVHFSNDGPLGQQNVDWMRLPSAFFGMWDDLNDTGLGVGTFTPNLTALIKWALGPLGYAKFYPPITLLILGLGAWTFFRSLKLTPLAATLGALAATLNSVYFAGACWGVASVEIALGMNFFALALIVANTKETPGLTRWTRLALVGCCVGMNVMEGADVGALCSILVALFAFFKALIETDGNLAAKAVRGASRVAVIAIFAGFIAIQTVTALIGFSAQSVPGAGQDTETKAQHWDWATQWSLPKRETLGILVPGLFGYRMDTPQNMLPALQEAYHGGVYWGGMGRSPEIDRYFDSGQQGNPMKPGLMMRFGYGGYYCGILVVMVALWAVAQSFRRKNSPFSNDQKKFVWFWTVVLGASLLIAWGRFAPIFYGLLYQLPYFSTIRNPAKFLNFFCWALVVLFAYGVHLLNLRYLESKPAKGSVPKLDAFNRKWLMGCAGVFGLGLLIWFYFSAHQMQFIDYLQKVGMGDANAAQIIASFCLGQITWFFGLFAVAIVLLTMILNGFFSGPRAKVGAILMGVFLVFDLGRANLPFIIHWDYKQKYEVGSLNPIVDYLRDKPYEHRVAYAIPAPFQTPPDFGLFEQIYRIEWMQHHFPFYNIQCLDIIQMPRAPVDVQTYLENFRIRPKETADGHLTADPESFPLIARHWELTNTRYLLGPAVYLDMLNQQLDPKHHSFGIVERFEIVPKPGITQPTQYEELTAVQSDNGRYALFEFTNALPRAKLYGNWQVNTNDQANLATLADLNFDPAKTVLISTPEPALPMTATNANSGTVEFKSYAPKHLGFSAQTTQPAVLLLNDRYDPNWKVTVDGKPAELLRCNYLMRGVYLTPGQHRVEFQFSRPNKPLYITLAAIVVAALLLVFLWANTRKNSAAQP